MLNLIKPYLGPIALICFDTGMNAIEYPISEFWSGALIAFAAFWFFFALASHTTLIKRFPGIKEWLPFVDPAGGVRAGAKELTGKYIAGHTFNITDLAYRAKIIGRHFEDCDIYGPAVLAVAGIGHVADCTFSGSLDSTFITVEQRVLLGPILLENCTFRKCRFHEIGFIGNQEAREKFAKGTT